MPLVINIFTKTQKEMNMKDSNKLTYLIGVYGTLKRGCFNDLSKGAFGVKGKFVGKDYIDNAQLYIDRRNLPILTPGNKAVQVELFEVDNASFEIIKATEERAGYTTVIKKTLESRIIALWWYTYPLDLKKLIVVDKYPLNPFQLSLIFEKENNVYK